MWTLEEEREHIGSIWSRATCLALSLAPAQSLERQAPRDSQRLRLQTVEIETKQHKQINKQYTKHFLITKKQYQKMLLVAMNAWVQESPKSEPQLRSYEGLNLIDLKR
jgi:hypothetical protein